MGLNRISWKLTFELAAVTLPLALPMGLNRISWKRDSARGHCEVVVSTLPMGLNRISWKRLG